MYITRYTMYTLTRVENDKKFVYLKYYPKDSNLVKGTPVIIKWDLILSLK